MTKRSLKILFIVFVTFLVLFSCALVESKAVSNDKKIEKTVEIVLNDSKISEIKVNSTPLKKNGNNITINNKKFKVTTVKGIQGAVQECLKLGNEGNEMLQVNILRKWHY